MQNGYPFFLLILTPKLTLSEELMKKTGPVIETSHPEQKQAEIEAFHKLK